MNLETLIGIAGVLLILCVFANKISDKFGVPSLLLFLSMGMLAGSDGIGGIEFYDAKLSNYVGTVALIFILYSGGLDTSWKNVSGVAARGSLLSTLGVFLTALFLFVLSRYIIGLSFEMALLLSVITSSTDAPAVFTILRSKGLRLKEQKLKSILELESGSNDPMAVLLSLGAVTLLQNESFNSWQFLNELSFQILCGLAIGMAFGKLTVLILQKVDFAYAGLYPVFSVGSCLLCYSLASLLQGNGFLAVYLYGITLSNHPFMYRRQLIKFQDSVSWIMQISMFLILGLLVNPSELGAVLPVSLACAFFLMFFARPAAVFVCMYKSNFDVKEKTLISWAGLKGSVPIILATYPLMLGLPNSQFLFNLIFFLVIISVLAQGYTLPLLAKRLGLDKKK